MSTALTRLRETEESRSHEQEMHQRTLEERTSQEVKLQVARQNIQSVKTDVAKAKNVIACQEKQLESLKAERDAILANAKTASENLVTALAEKSRLEVHSCPFLCDNI